MARIFNIYVTHKSATHSGMVSVRQTPFFTEYTLAGFDESLMHLLPGNKILSRGPDDFFFPNAGAEYKEHALMQEIIRALSDHMHARQT